MTITIRCEDYRTTLARVGDGEAALVLTDPPYGIGYQNNFTHKKHDVLTGDDAPFSYYDLASESYRILRDGSPLLAFTGWSEYPKHYADIEAAGFSMKEPLICQKRPSGKTDLYGTFQSNADWLIFAHKGRFRFRQTELVRNKRAGTVPNPGRRPVPTHKTRFPSCWFGPEYPWASENPAAQKRWRHPTAKGQQFLEWLIRLTTDPGDLVVDPFVGSGTTAAACVATGRRFVGCDVSADFSDMANKRVGNVEE